MKVGDLVLCKAGGPKMVIATISKATKIATCSWFSREQGEFHNVRMPLICLELAPVPTAKIKER